MKVSLTDAQVCRMAATQFETSADRYRDDGKGETAEAHEKLATHLRSLASDIDSLLFVPGEWICPKCQYFESRRIFSAIDGSIGINPTQPLPCPNDGEYLEPLTWRRYSEDLQKMMFDVMRDANRWKAVLPTLRVRNVAIADATGAGDAPLPDSTWRRTWLESKYPLNGVALNPTEYADALLAGGGR